MKNTYDSFMHLLLAHLCSIALALLPDRFSQPGGSSSALDRFLAGELPGLCLVCECDVPASVPSGNSWARTLLVRGFVRALTMLWFEVRIDEMFMMRDIGEVGVLETICKRIYNKHSLRITLQLSKNLLKKQQKFKSKKNKLSKLLICIFVRLVTQYFISFESIASLFWY